MSTPDPTSATAGANGLGWPDMPPATDPPPEEPAYVLWSPTGQESVFFYPPGSVEERLVTEHGIDSLVVRCQAAGSYDHVGDHSKQTGVHWCGRRPAGREPRARASRMTSSPAAQARGSVAGRRGCCRWSVPTSPACALATWICEPAGCWRSPP